MLTFDGQLCTLIKDRCEKENDTGIYRLTAVNSMGQAESICQVIVQSNDARIFRERPKSTRCLPTFIQTFQDQITEEGGKLLYMYVLMDNQNHNHLGIKIINRYRIHRIGKYVVMKNVLEDKKNSICLIDSNGKRLVRTRNTKLITE